MKSQPTVWVDLTDLSLWTGVHTGIQRVIYNLAVRYGRQGNARYFVYEEKSRSFYEVELGIVTPSPPPNNEMSRGRVIREEVTSRVRNYYIRLPEGVRYSLTPVLKPIVKGAYNKAHHLAFTTKRQLRRTRKKEVYTPAQFEAGDSVVILGAGWARPTILAELWRRKQTTPFEVIHFVHDVIPVYHPHLFGPGHFELFTRYLFDLAQVTDHIVTNSVASKLDTERFFAELNLPSPPIGVIRLADDIELTTEPARPNIAIEAGNYIFALGTIEIRKNYSLLYAAYKLAKLKGVQLPKLVISGRPGWLAGDTVYSIQHDPEVADRIIIFQAPHDTELVWLFKNCMYFVYPSMYEGWGMPIAEALVHGKMALTTSSSSMPEIAGDLLEYFNPFDVQECMELLAKYNDPVLREKAETRIQAEYKIQTWDMTFREFTDRVQEQRAAD